MKPRPRAGAKESRTVAGIAVANLKTNTTLSPNPDHNPASMDDKINETYTTQLEGHCPVNKPEEHTNNNHAGSNVRLDLRRLTADREEGGERPPTL